MKLINNKTVLAVLSGAMLTTAGCKKLSDFGDTNVNPAATTIPITSALLTNALTTLGTTGATAGFAADDKAAIFVQYFAESSYPSISLYAIPQVDFGGTYSGPLNDLQNIINTSTSQPEIAVARIVKSYLFWRLTDRFGDIPYFDALKGTDFPTPTFDKQELIYKDLIKENAEAFVQLDGAGTLKGDIHYGNDINKWKKLANSLRMMMALRLSNKFPGASDYAATEFKAGLAAGPIEANADNLLVSYPGNTDGFSNPFFIVNQANRDYGVSAPFGAIMSGLSDTRISAYSSTSNISDFVPYGSLENDINLWRAAHPNWARHLAPAYRTRTSPIALMTAARIWLARAEAAQLGWTAEDVTVAYNTGIDLSFAALNIPVPATYKTQAGVVLGTDNARKIATQQYLEAYPDGTEGWSVWRKTGFPVLTPSPNPSNLEHTTIPVRYTYGQRQLALNPRGVAAAVASQGPDKQETKVWWDQ